MDAASLTTKNKQRDRHLRSDDAAKGGFELPLTNLAAAAALAATGPGRRKIGPPLPRPLTTVAAAIGGLMAAGSLAKMASAARAAHASSPVAEGSAHD